MPAGTKEDPWQLSTAPGTSAYTMWADESADPPTLYCQVGSTQLRYQLRCLDDLHRGSPSRATGSTSAPPTS